MIFRRGRFHDLVGRQLDLFEEDQAPLLAEARERGRGLDPRDGRGVRGALRRLPARRRRGRGAAARRARDVRGNARRGDCFRVPCCVRPGSAPALARLCRSPEGGRLMARIEDYGLIGDLETAALVSRDGAIDWLCFPRFDSGAVFAALLGNEENGHWTIQPAGEFRRRERRYRGDTLVLETELETDDGRRTPRRLHAAPGDESRSRADRRGRPRPRRRCGWSSRSASTTARSSRGCATSTAALVAIAGPDARAPAHTGRARGRGPAHASRASPCRAGRARAVRPALVPLARAAARADRPGARARQTVAFWAEWAEQCTYEGGGATRCTARCSR